MAAEHREHLRTRFPHIAQSYTRIHHTDTPLQLLDFDVGPNQDTLDVEGVQLYPPTLGYFAKPFFVTQLEPTAQDALRLQVTGYKFHYSSAETVSEAGIELLPVTFTVTSIEGRPVSPPAVTINLLKDANGRLMIASFEAAKVAEASPADQEKECKEWPVLCKWRAYLSNSIDGIKTSANKACHKHKGGNPMAEANMEGKPPHRFRPGHPHHHPHQGSEQKAGHRHHHHHHPHHHSHQSMFFRRAFFAVLIPILIGIFAGTLTYLIGLALGYLIAIVVAKVRGRAAYERIALDDEEEREYDNGEYSNEKEAYIAELPDYDAPPVYEAAPEKAVVEGPDSEESKN